jgi:hypothetical protein
MPHRSPTLPCATSRPQDPPCCGRQVSLPASQRTSHPAGQGQSPQGDPHLAVCLVSPVVAAVGCPVVGVLGWFGPVGDQAFFQLGQRKPRPADLTIRAWQRREHQLRRDQAHPRGRSPRGRTRLGPNGLRDDLASEPRRGSRRPGSPERIGRDTSDDESYRCDQPCVARSAGTQS